MFIHDLLLIRSFGSSPLIMWLLDSVITKQCITHVPLATTQAQSIINPTTAMLLNRYHDILRIFF